jgi:hypothetical protein
MNAASQIAQRVYDLLTQKIGFAPHDIIIDPNILTVATGMSGARPLRHRLHRGREAGSSKTCPVF